MKYPFITCEFHVHVSYLYVNALSQTKSTHFVHQKKIPLYGYSPFSPLPHLTVQFMAFTHCNDNFPTSTITCELEEYNYFYPTFFSSNLVEMAHLPLSLQRGGGVHITIHHSRINKLHYLDISYPK